MKRKHKIKTKMGNRKGENIKVNGKCNKKRKKKMTRKGKKTKKRKIRGIGTDKMENKY